MEPGRAPEGNTDYVVDAHVENGKYRGFAYCPRSREIRSGRGRSFNGSMVEVVADAAFGKAG